jgi:chitosanase
LYYQPAGHTFEGLGMKEALSMLVIYDSQIHSGGIPSFLRQRFPELPPSKGGDEKAWIAAYVKVRHQWLSTHSRKILQKTIYRTQCFLNQIKNNNWDLSQVVIANGVRVP